MRDLAYPGRKFVPPNFRHVVIRDQERRSARTGPGQTLIHQITQRLIWRREELQVERYIRGENRMLQDELIAGVIVDIDDFKNGTRRAIIHTNVALEN